MKKRGVVITVLSLFCTALCAVCLVACGDKATGGDGHTHSYVNYVYNEDATCGKDGTETAKCEFCDKTNTRKSAAHPATGDHRYTDGVCTECGATQSPSEKVYKTVTFDPDGGVCSESSKLFEVGAVMQGLPIPTRNGHRFLGWYSGSQPYDAISLMPETDLELTAKWEKIATVYSDDYVSLKPATSGVKNEIHEAFGVDQCVYVEITSDDLKGGVDSDNNFTLRTLDGMEYTVKSGYSWIWYYDDDFSVVNGAQRFSLGYGDNLQFVTVNNASGVTVKTYLVNIYVLHDYYIGLHKTVYDTQPYDRVRVIEGELFSAKTATAQDGDLQFDKRVYLNENSGEYLEFDHSTPITKNWDLYQTYKPVTMRTDLGGGTLAGEVKIKPYTPYANLPLPEKSGFDFLGWKTTGDKYFADITGYTGAKYISSENASETLTAVFREKKYYFGCGTEKITQSDTVPVVTYTDETMTEILEVIYVPYNTDCRVPELTPKKDKAVFCQWLVYDKETGSAEPFDFDVKVTEPIALFADTMPYSGEDTLLTLNKSAIYAKTGTFAVYLPAVSRYVLEITTFGGTQGEVNFTVNAYGGNPAKNYTATEGHPAVVDLDIRSSGYVTLDVAQYFRGSFSIEICGALCVSEGDPLSVTDKELVAAGTKMKYTAKKLGHVISGFYDGDSLISDDIDHEFTVIAERREYGVSWQLNPQLECFNYVLSDDYLEISSIKDKTATEIIVPDDVTSIHGGAFSGCGSVASITLPFVGARRSYTVGSKETLFGWIFGTNSFTGGKATLQYCDGEKATYYIPVSLEKVTISGGNIYSGAFYGCNSLTNVLLPGNITNISYETFRGCSSLTSLIIPDSVTGISSSNAFSGCSKLIQTENGVQYVGKWVVDCDNSVTSVSLRANTVGIAGHAFEYCRNLISIEIPVGVTNIGEYAFNDCDGLTDIEIPDGVTMIMNKTFQSCNSLTSITIPNSVTIIGSEAFADCYELTSVVIPDNVTVIGGGAFNECYALKNINIPSSVTDIGINAFKSCNFLQNRDGVYYIGNWAVQCDTSVTSVALRDDTVGIATGTFSGCQELKDVTIPSRVKYMGSSVFQNTLRLKTVYCEAKDMPSGWSRYWNSYQYFAIVWDCKNKQ